MPWTCCQTLIEDTTTTCPKCDRTKRDWTVRFKKTRVFTLARDAWVEVCLLDPAGKPLAGEPYAIELPNGMKRKGKLNAEGVARVKSPEQGICKLFLPGYDTSELALRDIHAEAIKTAWVEVLIKDEQGRPMANAAYTLTLPDGEERKGKLSERGFLRLEGITPGSCRLELDGVDSALITPYAPPAEEPVVETAWVELVLKDDQGRPVAGAKYKLEPSAGEPKEGTLDDWGHTKITDLPPGRCKVSFPEHSFVEEVVAAAEHQDATSQPEAPKTWVELVLRDDQGRPLANQKYCLRVPGGEVQEGTLDEQGCARIGELEGERCEVWFPDVSGVELVAR